MVFNFRWEGPRCDKRMMNIPFKPLSERMLHEPFWLGLITVTVVLGVIGLVWCAKRHFPEKLEKLLAEEADRNRGGMYFIINLTYWFKFLFKNVFKFLVMNFCKQHQIIVHHLIIKVLISFFKEFLFECASA